ncbi:MAG: M48 family metalloprotease [Pseudomonadota bacterium]
MGQILVLLVPLLLLYLRDPPIGAMTTELGAVVMMWSLGAALLIVVLHHLAGRILLDLSRVRDPGLQRSASRLRRLQSLAIVALVSLYYVQIQVWYLPEALTAVVLPAHTPFIGDFLLLLPFVLPFLAVRVEVVRTLARLRGIRPSSREVFGGTLRLLGVVMVPQLLYLNAYRVLFLSGGPLAEWAGDHPAFAMGSGAFLFFLVFAVSPAMVRYLYPRTDMAEIPGLEPLDRELRELGRSAGLRIARIIVWRTGAQNIANAAVAGLLRRYQRFFITDHLLRRLTLPEIRAVMAHEIGHSKLRHPAFNYLLALSAGVFLIWSLLALVPLLEETGLGDSVTGSVLIIGLDGVYIFTIFSFFLRRFEHQADMVAVALSGSPEPFVDALERLGRLNLVPDKKRSLTHPALRTRIDWLRARLLEAPAEEWVRRFRRSNILMVSVILGLYALTLLLVELG